jgi:hypothetical protein
MEIGDTWVYQKEYRSGFVGHPDIERWTTEETIVSVTAAPALGGTLVTRRNRVLNHSASTGVVAANDASKKEPAVIRVLVRRNCMYPWDGGNSAPEYCFPIAVGKRWGKTRKTSPAEEDVWYVKGMNADPFGPPGAQTFRLWTHVGSGTFTERWFAEGVGVVQEVTEHHGTYDEERKLLLRSTIRGQTRSYNLTPATTTPISGADCEGVGWLHYTRLDGTPFHSQADCERNRGNRK